MIIKTLVKDQDRLNFLPSKIGKTFLKFEQLAYGFMSHFCEEYTGGFWNFYTLDNGGILMTLNSDQSFDVVNDMNYFEGLMSAEAASIGVNLFALNALANETQDSRLVDYYYALRDFAAEHSESSKIFGLID